MKKIYFAIKFCLVFVGIAANAQVIEGVRSPDVIPPSPTVANLMNFEEVPIDHYTGQPDISIPIYSKSLGGGLSLPIVLKYSTQSLKLDSHSGWTGTGWSLDAGGVISRTVRGHADEAMKGGAAGNVTGVFHNDKFWNMENLSYYEINEVLWNVDGTTMDKFDSQPDLFQISMPGFSGRFLIVKEGGTFKARQLDMVQNVRIDVTWGTNKVINGFTITDANGYKYLFGNAAKTIETSVTTSTTLIKQRDFPVTAAYVDTKTLPVCNTSWMLKSITTSNDEVLAKFTYQNSEETYKTGKNFTNNDFQNPQSFTEVMRTHPNNVPQFLPISTVSHNLIVTQTKKLSKITFRDSTAIVFTISSISHPENQGKYLTKIELTKFTSPNNEIIRTYNLGYHTTPRNRLFLTSVTSGSDFRYGLDYYQMDNFDAANDPIDNWGYTSGDHRADNTGAYGFNEYDKLAIQKGALIAINLPGGGRKEFSWEHHTFSYEGAAKLTDFTDNPDNVNENTYTTYFNSNMSGEYIIGQNITIGFEQYIQIEKSILPGSNADQSKFQVEFVNISTEQLGQLIKVSDITKKVSILPGTYRVQVRLNVLATTSDDDYIKGYINVRYLTKKTAEEYKYHSLGGGIRIAKVKFTEKDNNQFKSRIFNYRYTIKDYNTILRDSIVMSSGAVDLKTGLKVKTYYFTDKKYLFITEPGTTANVHFYQTWVPYKITTNQSNLMTTRGGYVGYKRVAVTEGLALVGGNSLNGTTPNGFTEYFYTNAIDAHYDPGVYSYPFVEKPNLDHKRGLLTKKCIFNKDGMKLEETINTYDIQQMYVTKLFTVTQVPCFWTQFYDFYQNFVNKTPNFPIGLPLDWYENCYGNSAFPTPFDWHITNIYATSSKLKKSINKQYLSTGQPVTKTTDLTYDINNYQLATQIETFTEGSETITLKTEYQYPVGGYDISLFEDNLEEPAITAMVGQNIINKPIVINSYKNDVLLNTMVNIYRIFPLTLNSSSSTTTYSTAPPPQILLHKVKTLKGGMPANTLPEDRLVFYGYNSIGNVTDVSMAGGKRTCYIWGYEGTLPVARIDNSTYSDLDQNLVNTIKTESNTGIETNLLSALNNFRNSYPIFSLSNLTTLTHHPVFGVLSTTDPKSLKTTFGYDYLGRLLWVRDNDGKLLTEYKYHFKGLFQY